MKKVIFVSLGAVLLASTPLAAQSTDRVTVIHAGKLLDMPGNPPRGPSTVIIRNGKIAEVLAGYQQGPAGATLIDLKDKFVLPGLIDSHVHLDSDAGGNAALIEAVTDSPARAAYRAAGNAEKTLMAGFTTVRNMGDGTGATLALRDAVAAGELPAFGLSMLAVRSQRPAGIWTQRYRSPKTCMIASVRKICVMALKAAVRRYANKSGAAWTSSRSQRQVA